LIHWPIAQKPDHPEFGEEMEDIPIIDTWREMEVSFVVYIYIYIFLKQKYLYINICKIIIINSI